MRGQAIWNTFIFLMVIHPMDVTLTSTRREYMKCLKITVDTGQISSLSQEVLYNWQCVHCCYYLSKKKKKKKSCLCVSLLLLLYLPLFFFLGCLSIIYQQSNQPFSLSFFLETRSSRILGSFTRPITRIITQSAPPPPRRNHDDERR
jgi:hypothetical protein